jgi:hypothetical protein
MSENTVTRRRFLVQAAVAATALPLLGAMAAPASAAPLPKLPLTNAQAKALAYIEDAAKTTNKAHKPGSTCANCQFFTAATGACTLFAGFSVAPKGWCTAWAKKAA